MDIPTIPGSWYTVASSTTCQITDTATGTPLGTADAGSYSFQAQGNLTTLSDDSALYSKSNFKSAPAVLMALGLLGGGEPASALPAGYIAAEFLESTGTQYIDTGIKPSENFGFYIDCQQIPTPRTEAFYVGVQAVANFAGWWLCFTSYTNYLLSVQAGRMGRGFTPIVNNKDENKRVKAFLNFSNDGFSGLAGDLKKTTLNKRAQEFSFTLFKARFGDGFDPTAPLRIFEYKSTNEAELERSMIPSLAPDGTPCMFDKVSKQPFYNKGTYSFIVGMTSKQALQLSKLRATGGTLTISLPTGYDADAGVMSALETARSNGWTLTIQTYDAETAAATFGMRRIWVRRTSDANGAYIDADEKRWQVDWCVEMYTPDGSTPDQHGYELFRSQEAAVAYWELQPWVDPEAENLLTE